MPVKNIFAICGSTRAQSSNLNLLKAISILSSDFFRIQIFTNIAALPHFNPDLDVAPEPAPVADFRAAINDADGIIICTPEYAMGVPGTLKNAIDWTVSSTVFSKKPTALITASSLGEKGHASLLETLKIIECNITEDTQLLIPHIKTKVNAAGEITDEKTLKEVNFLLMSLNILIENNSWNE